MVTDLTTKKRAFLKVSFLTQKRSPIQNPAWVAWFPKGFLQVFKDAKDPHKFGKITMHKLEEHPKTKKDVPPPPEGEHVT